MMSAWPSVALRQKARKSRVQWIFFGDWGLGQAGTPRPETLNPKPFKHRLEDLQCKLHHGLGPVLDGKAGFRAGVRAYLH